MFAKHITSVQILSAQEIIARDIFDIFGGDQTWAVLFEITQEFKQAFYDFMKKHADTVFDPDWFAADEEGDIVQHTVFSKDGHTWEFSNAGQLVMLGHADDEDAEVPGDAWIRPIATIRSVLRAM